MKKKIIIVSAVVAVILFAGTFLFIGSMRKSAVERERLYLLSRIWKDAYEQNSLWEFVPDLDWDECYAEYTSKVLDCKSDYDFYMLLDDFIANLQDRQFQLKFPDDSEVVPLPVYIEKIEDRYFISEVRISARTIPNKSEVLEVNSTPIDLYLQKSFGDSKSTEANYNNALNKLNYYQKKGSSVELSIVTPEGETKQETLTCVGENTALAASARIDRMNNLNIVKIYTYSKFTAYQFENDIFIIEGTESDQNSDIIRDLEKFLNSPVDGSFTPVIEKSNGYIIDLRNGTYCEPQKLLARFTESNDTGIITSPKVDTLLTSRVSKLLDNGGPFSESDRKAILMLNNCYNSIEMSMQLERYKLTEKPVVLLQGTETFGSGEIAAHMAKSSKEILLIGTNSAGMPGDVSVHKVNGVEYRFSHNRVISSEGYDLTGFGVQPEIWSELTADDFQNNRDTAILKAIELINQKNSNPLEYKNYLNENRYEYTAPSPLETPGMLMKSIERLSSCGTADGVLTSAEKLLGLAETWRRIWWYYCGWNSTEEFEGWDETFISYIPKVLKSGSIDEYYRILDNFIEYLGQSGCFITYSNKSEEIPIDNKEYQFSFESFGVMKEEENIYSLKIKSFALNVFANDFVEFLDKTGVQPEGIILDIRSLNTDNDSGAYHILKLFDTNYQATRPFYSINDNNGIKSFHSFDEDGSVLFETSVSDIRTVYNGPVVLLVDNNTTHTAEVVAAFASVNKRFTLIGTNTSGNPGGTAAFVLPESKILYVPLMQVIMPDKSILTKDGIEPTIRITQTQDDTKQGIDTSMLTAVEYIKNN